MTGRLPAVLTGNTSATNHLTTLTDPSRNVNQTGMHWGKERFQRCCWQGRKRRQTRSTHTLRVRVTATFHNITRLMVILAKNRGRPFCFPARSPTLWSGPLPGCVYRKNTTGYPKLLIPYTGETNPSTVPIPPVLPRNDLNSADLTWPDPGKLCQAGMHCVRSISTRRRVLRWIT